MSTEPAPRPAELPPSADQKEIKIVSHSTLFYWWPVWALGFILAALTYINGHNLAIVPRGAVALHEARGFGKNPEGNNIDFKDSDVLVLGGGDQAVRPGGKVGPEQPSIRIAENKSYGVLYAIVLLLVIVITNVPLRGLWSVVVLVIVVLGSIIFALAGWWDSILEALGRLHIHINAAGYLLISLGLFAIWFMTFMFFDQQIYMVFTPRQLRVRQEIGGGEIAYDTTGMVIQKQRNDLFRHWFLGLGSGDLIVNTSGANAHHFDLPNVLFVGYKVKEIEEMLREVPVVRG